MQMIAGAILVLAAALFAMGAIFASHHGLEVLFGAAGGLSGFIGIITFFFGLRKEDRPPN
jgi:hypothetical protein